LDPGEDLYHAVYFFGPAFMLRLGRLLQDDTSVELSVASHDLGGVQEEQPVQAISGDFGKRVVA
jgi:hypothetical protein